MARMRPRGTPLRTVTPWMRPGKARSSTYWARPVTFSRPSFLRTDCPRSFSSMCRIPGARRSVEPDSIPDPVAFFGPGAKWFQSLGAHDWFEWNPALGVLAFEFFINKRVVKAGVGGVACRRGEIDAIRPRPIDRAEAHRAGLATRVQFAAG